MMLHLWQEFPDHITLGIMITFVLGQRLSDMALIRTQRISRVSHDTIGITIIEGKVIPSTGPYSLYLNCHFGVGLLLLQFLQSKKATVMDDFLFQDPSSFKNQAHLRLANIGLENRSVRRGGLQHMAAAGIPPQELLQFSRHTSIQMLMRYLGYLSLADSTQMTNLTCRAFPALLQRVI